MIDNYNNNLSSTDRTVDDTEAASPQVQNWYNSFGTDEKNAQQKENKINDISVHGIPEANILYLAMKLQSFADFISQVSCSLDCDVREKNFKDFSVTDSVQPVEQQPAFSVYKNNRNKLNECLDKIKNTLFVLDNFVGKIDDNNGFIKL